MTMTTLARSVTGGVDTHLDVHVAAALDEKGTLFGVEYFETTREGYKKLLAWLEGFGAVVLVGVEGTSSYGAGLTRHLLGEPGAIRARAFDADEDDRAEVLEPREQLLVALPGGLEVLDPEQRAFLVERCDDMDVEVRIDTAGHAACQSGHRHPILGRLGWHRTRWTTDKTAMGRLRGKLL